METRRLAIIVILAATVFVTVFADTGMASAQTASSNLVSKIDSPPIIIRQVELYGPVISRNDVFVCGSRETGTGSQWFELYNPTNKTAHIQGFNLEVTTSSEVGGSIESSIGEIDIGPQKNCIFALLGVHQAYIPDPRNIAISFSYNYSGIKYTTLTPSLTDTYNDTRIWQLDHDNWTFVAPSPLKQTRSGIASEYVVCNNDFKLVINTQNHSPACVKPSSVLRIELLGWIESKRQEYIPVLDRTYNSGPGFGCPFIFPHISILNSSGFETYNDSGIIHYILKQGQHGAFTYQIFGSSYSLDPPIFSPSKVDITNGVDIYFQPNLSSQIKQKMNSPITVLFEPQSERIDYDGYANVVAKISANSTAQTGTYWLTFVPGTCSEISPIPIVIGNQQDATDRN